MHQKTQHCFVVFFVTITPYLREGMLKYPLKCPKCVKNSKKQCFLVHFVYFDKIHYQKYIEYES